MRSAYCAATKSTNGPRSWRRKIASSSMCGGRSDRLRRRQAAGLCVHTRERILHQRQLEPGRHDRDRRENGRRRGSADSNYRLGALGFFSHPDVVKESGRLRLNGSSRRRCVGFTRNITPCSAADPTRVTARRRVRPAAIRFAHIWPRPVRLAFFAQAMMQSGSCISIPLAQAAKKRPR